MKSKYAGGGRVPSYEEDTTPPRGMMGRSRGAAVPSYEEDITPPPGMRGTRRREEALPTPPIPPRDIPPRRMKAGGAVTRGDGCAAHGKTKGKMV